MKLTTGALAWMIFCAGCGDTSDEMVVPSDYDAFDAWREIQAVVRESPDNVPARAEALVAARDVDGLFELVRDDIALLPATAYSMGSSTEIRWGHRATLRGQAGTMRERAELLAHLLQEAGFEAKVVAGRVAPDVNVAALLSSAPNRTIQ